MIFIIDLDYTIYNTSRLKKEMIRSVKNLGASEAIWLWTYKTIVNKNIRGYDYDIKKHSRLLARAINGNAREIESHQKRILEKSSRFLYPDTINFLEFLKKNNAKMVLMTLGNIKWQKQKVKNMKIKKYFDRLIFTRWHKKYLKLKFNDAPQNWIFINDNIKEINDLRNKFPKSIFWLIKRRDGKKFDQKEYKIKIPTFSDLISLKKYMLKKKLFLK